jgi:CHASE2 domain-containing sensor protein
MRKNDIKRGLTKLELLFIHWVTNAAGKTNRHFFIYVAIAFSLFVLVDAAVFHFGENMREKAFDFMVSIRLIVPKPDKDIVVVDINEASLAAMAKEYGRYPWPRQVFGEFLEHIREQKPRAVVFDIVFSDADIIHPEGDAYFNDVIASSDNAFFAFVRLHKDHDKLSQIRPAMISGVTEKGKGQGDPNATIALVLPHFQAAIDSGRLGFNNIYPDDDSIVREYALYQDDYGWELPSLALSVGRKLGYDVEDSKSVLLNWRGKPFTHQYVSFSDVFTDMTSKEKRRPQDEFTGKIVIIGSTAPSLFDMKATPMAKIHPGVDILATAIDNVKHGDYLHVWRGVLFYILMSLALIWLTTWSLYMDTYRNKKRIFSFSQIGLLVVSYIGINVTDTYIDLSGPVFWAVTYFSVAETYSVASDLAMQRWLAYGAKPDESDLHALVMPVLVKSKAPLSDDLLKELKWRIRHSCRTTCRVDALKGTQGGIWGLFGDMLVVSWTYAGDEEEYGRTVEADAERLAGELSSILVSSGFSAKTQALHALHRGGITRDKPLGGQWRALFAQAVIKLEYQAVAAGQAGRPHLTGRSPGDIGQYGGGS